MAYAEHWRIRAQGVLGSTTTPVDDFSYGFCNDATADFLTPTQVNDIGNAVANFHGSVAAKISSAAILEEIRISKIATDGTVIPGTTYIVPTTTLGQGGTAVYPYQVALCVSLGVNTDSRRAKGRFYLPTPTIGFVAATGQMVVSGTTRADLLAGVWAMFGALETAFSGDMCVASKADGNHTVNNIRLGSVFDTQRRRRNQLVEDYLSDPR